MRKDAHALPIPQSPHHLPLLHTTTPLTTVQMRDTIESPSYEREEGERGDKDKKREKVNADHMSLLGEIQLWNLKADFELYRFTDESI